jgi:ParB-like chromosome segregation protein Spo0J
MNVIDTHKMTSSDKMEYDEIANLFPMGPEEELKELATSIGANGLQVPIVLLDGKILDGRRRAHACEMAGVEPRYTELPSGTDPYEFVAAMNIHRRHLDKSQRALIAEKMWTMKHGGDRKSYQVVDRRLDTTRERAAQIMNVGLSSVERVRRTRKNGVPEVIEAMEKGVITVDAASKITALPKEEQATALAQKTRKERVTEKTKKPQLQQPHPGARLTSMQIAEYEAKTKAPSIYPEGLPFPVHPNEHLTEHLHEALVELKTAEPLIPQMSRHQLYENVWMYTQRIQTFAPGFGKPALLIKDINPRWVEWARNVAGKVRAREHILIERQRTQSSPTDKEQSKKPKRQFANAFEKRLKNWYRVLRRTLNEIHFALEEEQRVFQATEHILIDYFEERRAWIARRAPSKTGETNQIANLDSAQVNGSPSLEGEQQ